MFLQPKKNKKNKLYTISLNRDFMSWSTNMSEEMVVSIRMTTHGFILASACKYYVSLVTWKSQQRQKMLQWLSRKHFVMVIWINGI